MENCCIYTTENTDINKIESIVKQIGEIIHQYDTKQVFTGERFYIEDYLSDKWIGEYNYNKQECIFYD